MAPFIRFAIDDKPGSPVATWQDGQLSGDAEALHAFEMWEGFPVRLTATSTPTTAGHADFWQTLAFARNC